jgi:DNA-binding MarR family transcriptional regulator
MTIAPTLSPQVLGRAEKAHAALLDRILSGTPLAYNHWVAFNVMAAPDGRINVGVLVERMIGALKIDEATARNAIGELSDLTLIEPAPSDASEVELTDEGKATYLRLRKDVDETIGMLYAGISHDELATAGRVLALITERADAELAGETHA